MDFEFEDDSVEEFCPTDVDVLIVGAGLAGLTAAYKLLQKERSLSIRILEANAKIGGNLIRCPLGELGGKFITEEQHHVFNLIRSLDAPMTKRRTTKPNLPRCWDLDEGSTSFLAKYELKRYTKDLDKNLFKYRSSHYRKCCDKRTMLHHIESKLFFTKSRNFMENVVLMTCGMDAGCVLFQDFMQICASYGGVNKLLELYFIIPEKLWEINSRSLLESFEKHLKDVDIRKNIEVNEIQYCQDYVKVVDSTKTSHCAGVVILAVPWPDIVDIHNCKMTPDTLKIPEDLISKKKFAKTSIIARFSQPHWLHAGYSGTFLSDDPLIVGYEQTRNIYCCVCIHDADVDCDIDVAILKILSKYFGKGMLQPIELYMKTFCLDYVKPSHKFNKFDRIIWCSSGVTGSCHRGSLNGAVETGMRAALNALGFIRPQAVSYQDAAEVRCKAYPPPPKSTLIESLTSGLNFYNLGFYGAFIILLIILCMAWRFDNYSAIDNC